MGIFFYLSRRGEKYGLSIIGISIIGAFSHNMVQLLLAYFILIRHSGIFIFLPWLSLGAVVMGYLIGIVARGVCQNLEKIDRIQEYKVNRQYTNQQFKGHYVPGFSPLHGLSGRIKLISVIILSLAVLITNSLILYVILFVFLAVAWVLSHTPLSFLLQALGKDSPGTGPGIDLKIY